MADQELKHVIQGILVLVLLITSLFECIYSGKEEDTYYFHSFLCCYSLNSIDYLLAINFTLYLVSNGAIDFKFRSLKISWFVGATMVNKGRKE